MSGRRFFILRAIIFANGELTPPISIIQDDVIIAANGGAHHCLEHHIDPLYVIGDLDSLSSEEVNQLQSKGAKVIRYPVKKDFTDLELALQHALELNTDEILIYGALGRRWDQTLANLLLASAYPQAEIRLVDGNQEFYYVQSGETRKIPGQPGDTVSLVPLTERVEGITTNKLEYPLSGETLHFGSTRGVSNIMQEDQASVQVRNGLLLCVVIHQL
jgi:thiamine pyrophosphokinase